MPTSIHIGCCRSTSVTMETAPGRMDTHLSPEKIPGIPPRLSHAVLVVLVLIVATFAVRFGMDMILLASKGEMRDFAACYTAAVVARAGGAFYDPQPGRPWFAENENRDLIAAARRLGTLHRHEEFEHVHIFSYPPAMMFFMLPFSFISFHVAKLIWLALSLFAMGWGMWLVGRTIHSHTLSSFCMVSLALIFQPVRNTLELGQVNALMFILLAVFFALYRGGRDVPAGLVLGLSIAIRLHPAMLVLYLMWRREFRTAVVALATAVAVTLLAVPIFGLDQSVIYFTQVAPKFARGLVSVENHSLAGFLATIGSGLGVTPADQEVGSPWTARIAAGLVLAMAAVFLARPVPARRSCTADLEFALVLVLIPLATPNATINHLTLLLPSYWILFERLLSEGSTGNLLVPSLAGLSAILIGVVNDFYAHPLLSKGLLVFIGEIKFYGLVLLYAAIVSLLFKIRRSEGLGSPARL